MASFFSRLFSPKRRQATTAEERGDHLKALKIYQKINDFEAVIRVRLQIADETHDLPEKVRILRERVTLNNPPEIREKYSRTLAHALIAQARDRWIGDRHDRTLLSEAASILETLQDLEHSADLFLEAGMETKAYNLYVQAGSIAKMDALKPNTPQHSPAQRSKTLLNDFNHTLQTNRPLQALQLIKLAIKNSPNNPALEKKQAQLLQTLPPKGTVSLISSKGDVTLLNNTPLTIGRSQDATITLLAPGISRQHARLHWDKEQLLAEDLNSKSGLFCDGKICTTPTPLQQSGTLTLGKYAALHYERPNTNTQHLRLRPIPKGKGAREHLFFWGQQWATTENDHPLPPNLNWKLQDGFWHLFGDEKILFDGNPQQGLILLRPRMSLDIHGISFRVASF